MATITHLRTDAEAGQLAGDGLALYDLTCRRLRDELAGRLPDGADLEATVTAYAYWVCSVVQKRGANWETTLQEYIGHAARDAVRETEAEQAEFAQVRRALRGVAAGGALLDIGAGWGRLAPLYEAADLAAVYVEPTDLGVRLMRRRDLRRVAIAKGEMLPFRAGMFDAALIGWVLHHHSAELDAARIAAEVARVLAPGGWLFSIEPLRPGFDMARWRELLAQAGITIDEAHEFYRMPNGRGDEERYTLVIGHKPRGRL